MCVTEVYVDRYPDGRETGCQQFQPCQYGRPGQPCAKHSTNKNPVRSIGFGENTTEYILATAARNRQEQFPITPPRSSGGSHHRTGSHASYASSRSDGSHRSSKHRSAALSMKPTREHRKERIVIVESPPTPRTPPQPFPQTFTAPSSPATPPYTVDGLPPRERGRPIIVDERTTYRTRAPSLSAVIGERPRRGSPMRKNWDSPSSSHTSIDLGRIREQERADAQARAEQDRRDREHDNKMANMEASIRLAEKIKQRDAEIRNRPAVPIAPLRSIMKTKPVVDQSTAGLSHMMRKMSMSSEADLKLREEAEIRKRLEIRDRESKMTREMDRDRREEDAMAQRLRERQLPGRRFSVGPGGRRTRVVYDDGVYRWE